MELSPEIIEQLARAAENARMQVYAPYSKFEVLAAVMTTDGEFYGGANVENASLTLTVHAENNAIMNALYNGVRARCGNKWLAAIYTRCPHASEHGPCGLCRQAIKEWCTDTCIWIGEDPVTKERTQEAFTNLLPRAFGPDDLDL